jgi:Uma2 family endonuclease
MNELSPQPRTRPTTQAAEGVPRLRWSLPEFERLTELGILTENDRIELIGGELVPMSPKGNRHENVKSKLVDWMYRRLPQDLLLSVELGWRPNNDSYLEPDILVFRGVAEPSRVPPSEVLLAIEIAVSSLAYDAGRKSQIYSGLGVPDYWVIDAVALATRVYREPAADGYASITEVRRSEALLPLLVAPIAVRLDDLRLD